MRQSKACRGTFQQRSWSICVRERAVGFERIPMAWDRARRTIAAWGHSAWRRRAFRGYSRGIRVQEEGVQLGGAWYCTRCTDERRPVVGDAGGRAGAEDLHVMHYIARPPIRYHKTLAWPRERFGIWSFDVQGRTVAHIVVYLCAGARMSSLHAPASGLALCVCTAVVAP